MPTKEIWQFLAGLGFFLFAMNLLETLLRNTSGRSLKLFLKKHTNNLFKAIAGGTIVTTIVQSSSVVSLIVLAFVESGVITFRNGLGVILGSNLGTTLSNWIVATVGFKVDILAFTLPVIALSTIGMFLAEKRKVVHVILSVFFSIGMLFLGLDFMKGSALVLVKELDLSMLSAGGPALFVLAGFVLTSIIQSSSATVAIALTAIYSGLLPLQSAAALVIGSEVGTTVKVLFWGMKGSAEKKRVAAGNFIYNLATAVLAYLALDPLLRFTLGTMQISDHLIALVFFQSAINVAAIIIFTPFLGIFSAWLARAFVEGGRNGHLRNLPAYPLLAADTLKIEAQHLLESSILFNERQLTLMVAEPEGIMNNLRAMAKSAVDTDAEYEQLKSSEGEVLAYYAGIQAQKTESSNAWLMLQYVNSCRQSVYAAKAMKDIAHNLRQFMSSTSNLLHRQPAVIRNDWIAFGETVRSVLSGNDKSIARSKAEAIQKSALAQEEQQRQDVIRWLKKGYLGEVEASTCLNMYREILASKKAVVQAAILLASEYVAEPTA